jgi:NADH-quinone oxidoreductase subunit L
MTVLAWLPFYPLISFLILIVFGKRLSWALAASLSVGALFLSAFSSFIVIQQLASSESKVLTVQLWQWFSLGSANVNFTLYLDALSAVMISVVTGIGALIHLYAAGYMKSDENFSRFMAYMNLFIVAMLLLVLADNLVLLYLGWEGVGLCSFLLIGFWYQDKNNALAARKAFIVTRIGDTAMAIALFMLFSSLGELNIVNITELAQTHWQVGDQKVYWIALLLLGGAVGKSAQLPLQTWLPDAMAGPTPVSALIHAATMVTAGVYLIARMHGVFLLAPEVMTYVAWVGGLTLLMAGFAALAQTDIKRVLAYSTMSQIGYMMLALGAGAWSEGIFHLMTHAFFKALLFLTAGSVILALHHQQDLFKMGGLLKKLPIETTLFAIGLVCLVALPGTSGFYSKEAIIGSLWSSTSAGPALWWCAILGALLTSIYSCRLFFLAFLGKARNDTNLESGFSAIMRLPLYLLAILALFGGLFSGLVELNLTSVFADSQGGVIQGAGEANGVEPHWLHVVAIATPFIGIAFSWFYFADYRKTHHAAGVVIAHQPSPLGDFLLKGLGFDTLYQTLLVKPFCFIAKVNRRDIFDQIIMSSRWYVDLWREALVASQTGGLRWYAATLGLAVVFLLGVILL